MTSVGSAAMDKAEDKQQSALGGYARGEPLPGR